MKHNPDLKAYSSFGLSFNLALGAVVLGFLFLTAAPPSATAFGPPNAPGLGQPPVPNAGWQAQELGGIQPWWGSGRVYYPDSGQYQPRDFWKDPFFSPQHKFGD